MSFFSSSKKNTSDPVEIGDASIFDFLCSTFSRIAYTEDPMPLFLVSGIFRIIPKEIFEALSKVKNINEQYDEQKIFELTTNPKNFPIREYNGKKYINFIGYAERINILIEDTAKSPDYKNVTDPKIKIISIADSNYGDCLVIGSQYLPNFVFTSFRGTYSTKTAASYVRPDSIMPSKIDDITIAIYGIAKITLEIIHTVVDAIDYMVTTFLQPNNGNLVIPVFTGHSLGGAMATLFDFEYCHRIENINSGAHDQLAKTAICVSFGAPRVLGKSTSSSLCQLVVSGKTLVHRYSNDGDPVTSLPPPNLGFYHPCSTSEDKKAKNRQRVSRDCRGAVSGTIANLSGVKINYLKSINCSDQEKTGFSKLTTPNMLDHMEYLYISFVKAADVVHLFLGSALTTKTTEINRVHDTDQVNNILTGDTEMRIIVMTGNNGSGIYSDDFIDLKKLERSVGKSNLMEDSLDSIKLFSDIIGTKTPPVTIKFKKDNLPEPIPKDTADNLLVDVLNIDYKRDITIEKPIFYSKVDLPNNYIPVAAPATGGNKTKKHNKRGKKHSKSKFKKQRKTTKRKP